MGSLRVERQFTPPEPRPARSGLTGASAAAIIRAFGQLTGGRPMHVRSFACLTLALAALVVGKPGVARAAETPLPEVDLTWGAKIPLRDGVHLNATIYRPHGQTDPLPVIFT